MYIYFTKNYLLSVYNRFAIYKIITAIKIQKINLKTMGRTFNNRINPSTTATTKRRISFHENLFFAIKPPNEKSIDIMFSFLCASIIFIHLENNTGNYSFQYFVIFLFNKKPSEFRLTFYP